MKAFRNIFPGLSAMLMAAVLVCSCSSDNDVVVAPTTLTELESAPIHFKTQLGAKGGSDNQAKAITLSFEDDDNNGKGPQRVIARPGENDKMLNTSWAVGEKVALVYEVNSETHVVEATVTSVSNGIAGIEGELTGSPTDNTAVKIVFPYAAVNTETNETGTKGEIKTDYLKTGQDGTIATISQKYDVAVGYGNFSIASNSTEASLKEMVDLQNLYAILRMKFTDTESAAITGINRITVTNTSASPETKLFTVRGSDTDGYIYVVMEPVSTTTTIRFTAATDDYIYNGTASLSLLEASKYYRATLKLPSKEELYVDLGLSVKWAKMNVGASKPEEYGDWFAWGETEPYYTEGHAPITDVSSGIWKASLRDPSRGYSYINYFDTPDPWLESDRPYTEDLITYKGFTTRLKPEHDAATANWGNSWRMPTFDEIEEFCHSYPPKRIYDQYTQNENPYKGFSVLIENYNNSGVDGLAFYKGSDPSNIALFLPFGGRCNFLDNNWISSKIGFYWSSDVRQRTYPEAHFLFIDEVHTSIDEENFPRWYGCSVRPVYAP